MRKRLREESIFLTQRISFQRKMEHGMQVKCLRDFCNYFIRVQFPTFLQVLT